MSSEIRLKDQFVWVSNRRLAALIDFALQVGGETAGVEAERGWVETLRRFAQQAWPGIEFDLDERFPTHEEKKFWARVFHEVARRIFLRRLGSCDNLTWQASAIGDASILGRMLTRAVQEVELAWLPESKNVDEGEPRDDGRINVRF